MECPLDSGCQSHSKVYYCKYIFIYTFSHDKITKIPSIRKNGHEHICSHVQLQKTFKRNDNILVYVHVGFRIVLIILFSLFIVLYITTVICVFNSNVRRCVFGIVSCDTFYD